MQSLPHGRGEFSIVMNGLDVDSVTNTISKDETSKYWQMCNLLLDGFVDCVAASRVTRVAVHGVYWGPGAG
jgi:hypothetical protein